MPEPAFLDHGRSRPVSGHAGGGTHGRARAPSGAGGRPSRSLPAPRQCGPAGVTLLVGRAFRTTRRRVPRPAGPGRELASAARHAPDRVAAPPMPRSSCMRRRNVRQHGRPGGPGRAGRRGRRTPAPPPRVGVSPVVRRSTRRRPDWLAIPLDARLAAALVAAAVERAGGGASASAKADAKGKARARGRPGSQPGGRP